MSNGNSHCSLNLLLWDLSPSLNPLYSFLLKAPPSHSIFSRQKRRCSWRPVAHITAQGSLPSSAWADCTLSVSPQSRDPLPLLSISLCLTVCLAVSSLSSLPITRTEAAREWEPRSLSLPPGPSTAKKHGMSCTNGPLLPRSADSNNPHRIAGS